MGQNASLPEDVKVVIVGGGYGGCRLALDLMQEKANFTLIDARDAFHHNVASVRAIAVPGLATKTMMPYATTFGDHFKRGVVVDIDPANKVVKLEGGDTVTYDALVLATGTSGPFPCKFGHEDREQAVKIYDEYNKKIQGAQKIAIVGGGAVGVETAAEIATEYPDKEVTIIHSKQHLIGEDMNADFYKRLNEILETLKIKTILGAKVTNLGDLTDGPSKATTDKDTTVEADLFIKCTGLKVNTEAFNKPFGGLLEANGALRVNEYFQVGEHENIYAIGDCCQSGDPWLAYVAQEHAKKVLENLKRKFNGAEMHAYKGDPNVLELVLSLGKNHGIGQKKSGGLLSEFMCTNIKSKDMFVNRYWHIMKQTPPAQIEAK